MFEQKPENMEGFSVDQWMYQTMSAILGEKEEGSSKSLLSDRQLFTGLWKKATLEQRLKFVAETRFSAEISDWKERVEKYGDNYIQMMPSKGITREELIQYYFSPKYLKSRETSDREFQEAADRVNQGRSIKDKILGRNKVSHVDIAREEAIQEEKIREGATALFREIKTVLPELDKGKDVVYLKTSGRILRLVKSIEQKNLFIIMGHGGVEDLLKEIKMVVEKLIQEHPDKKFEIGQL